MSDGVVLRSGGTGTASVSQRRPAPGETAMRRMVEDAKYELNIDAYRGMMRTANSTLSPWEASCRWGAPLDENDSTPCTSLVQMTCQNQCPCMIQWTEQSRKRKRSKKTDKDCIGTRPEAGDRCLCDYNPFCLASLGGAMDEVWQRRCARLSEDDSSDCEILESASDAGVSVLDPSELSVDPTMDLDKTIYCRRTWSELRTLRDSQLVDRAKVAEYLKETLQDLTSTVSVDTCIERIEAWHRQLLFVNPLKKAPASAGQLRISIPPGIENLGATCYLNTQLQCLARINVFLKGIFSWRAPEGNNDKVHEVLTLFQRILADLNIGKKCTTTTEEFSNALGIDHYEQQDPNEFSRLFFDLMHNAFQKEATSSSPGGLPELLPHLFAGTIENSIICQRCSRNSARKETFMDLNVPISVEKDRSPRKNGQQSILERLMPKKRELDVQFLFDEYCRDESLEDENQYYCEHCGSKQNATRRVKFTKLPHLLNIQLSRYIFDMKSLSKKKVSEKVLLPLQMTVHTGKDDSSETEKHTYLLCAVMIHKGKSAYSGHYIAQAMDWDTGCWFEFNDTKVKLLDHGPDNSFDLLKGSGKPAKGVSGSQDAYNLYYVEENFLAASVVERIQDLVINRETADPILQMKDDDRSQWYDKLAENCIKDRAAADRLKNRRDFIVNDLFSPQVPLDSIVKHVDPPPVWVHGNFLRRFFSCKDTFEGELAHDIVEDVIKTSQSLCGHSEKGISPREARRGKLLPRVLYETIVDYLRTERRDLLGADLPQIETSENGFVITPAEGMFCQECVNEFQQDLRPKMDLLEDYLYLFENLTVDELLVYEDGTEFQLEQEKYVYFVSRKFCTALRGHIREVMKKVSQVGTESFSIDEKLLPTYESYAEGIDTLGMEEIEMNEESKIDIYVNQNLTCPHGKCRHYTKNQVRLVSWKVWAKILKLFPGAIEHRREKRSFSEENPVEMNDDCASCDSVVVMAQNLGSELSILAKRFSSSSRSLCYDFDSVVLGESGQVFHAVHAHDIAAMKRFCNNFKVVSPKAELEKLVQEVLNCFRVEEQSLPDFETLDSDSSNYDETNRRVFDVVKSLICPLKCRLHDLPVERTVTALSGPPWYTLSPHVRLLDQNEMQEFVSFLCILARLLIMPDIKCSFSVTSEADSFIDQLLLTKSVFRWYPTARVTYSSPTSDSRKFTVTGQVGSANLLWLTDLCGCQECMAEFERYCQPESKAEAIDKEQKTGHGGRNDPIVIDADETADVNVVADTFSLAVYEAHESASEARIAEGLGAQHSGFPNATENDPFGPGVRRSTRRRSTRIPVEPFTSQESVQADICHNIAALRLSLLESLKEGSEFSLDHRLFLAISPGSKQPPTDNEDWSFSDNTMLVRLDFTKNETTLLEVVEAARGGDISSLSPKDSLVLVRQAGLEETAEILGSDNILDVLIGQSNSGVKDPIEKKRRSRNIERGFTGTLLTPASTAPQGSQNGDKSMEEPSKTQSSQGELESRAIATVGGNGLEGEVSVGEEAVLPGSSEKSLPNKRRKMDDESTNVVQMDEDTDDDQEVNLLPINGPHDDDKSHLFAQVMDKAKEIIVEVCRPKLLFEACMWAMNNSKSTEKKATASFDVDALVNDACAKYFELND